MLSTNRDLGTFGFGYRHRGFFTFGSKIPSSFIGTKTLLSLLEISFLCRLQGVIHVLKLMFRSGVRHLEFLLSADLTGSKIRDGGLQNGVRNNIPRAICLRF